MNSETSIAISVQTQYIQNEMLPEGEQYAFAYKITITNNGDISAQLLNRYWLITDGDGKQTEVAGEGVVGQQPHIAPADTFEYTSGAVLKTPVGSMQGYYEFIDVNGRLFKAPIEVFSLSVPNKLN
ncbi:Co2+/Mg2+ efflux protein ApaG [Aliiglaciecola sp. LCG003]|uniref:Co2+/Mg2+ efflux protein ApaG n=1 Tax=Aliiglaciecola sp. LCG003 TaxID=3053655 RepID=UPI0025739C37|nr:Co2+/Mg2+ efflux protein ApaG [Aliiglaciecola sp. LCG003]WJG10184.1 Co2+/Mg2+ efflux protein ApaG [Aliiglaciecola sp. LCG003]